MHIRTIIQQLAILLPSVLWTASATAEGPIDFSKVPFWINVPLELNDMHPDVTGGRVTCEIKGAGDVLVATGAAGFSIDTVTRSTMLTPSVPLNLVAGKAIPDGHTYACTLWLTDGEKQLAVAASGAQPSPKFDVVPGKPFNTTISGVIASSMKTMPTNNKTIKNPGVVR